MGKSDKVTIKIEIPANAFTMRMINYSAGRFGRADLNQAQEWAQNIINGSLVAAGDQYRQYLDHEWSVDHGQEESDRA